jgi:hypothetical protein
MPSPKIDISINRLLFDVSIQLIVLTFKYLVKHLIIVVPYLLSVTDLNDPDETFKFIVVIIIIILVPVGGRGRF